MPTQSLASQHSPTFPAGSPLDYVQRALDAVITAQDAALRDPEVRRILGDAGAKLAILKADRYQDAINDGRRAMA